MRRGTSRATRPTPGGSLQRSLDELCSSVSASACSGAEMDTWLALADRAYRSFYSAISAVVIQMRHDRPISFSGANESENA